MGESYKSFISYREGRERKYDGTMVRGTHSPSILEMGKRDWHGLSLFFNSLLEIEERDKDDYDRYYVA